MLININIKVGKNRAHGEITIYANGRREYHIVFPHSSESDDGVNLQFNDEIDFDRACNLFGIDKDREVFVNDLNEDCV